MLDEFREVAMNVGLLPEGQSRAPSGWVSGDRSQ